MLSSLFGELSPFRARENPSGSSGFAATAILESVATEVNVRGEIVDRHSQDLVVSGSPAQAIRDHFSVTRGDLDTAASLITLVDPAGVWASAVIKALADAAGRPIERLHLRDHATLRTLATIERTTLVRRHELQSLRIYHAEVRQPGPENAEIPIALMERSQMTTVIVGPLEPHALDAMLGALLAATRLPTWRCPDLLFMLPPNAVWIATKIEATDWPRGLNVHVISESMSGASAVWNAMLGQWNQIGTRRRRDAGIPSAEAELTTGWGTGVDVGADAANAPGRPTAAAALAAPVAQPPRLGATQARAALASAGPITGLLACAVVDAGTGRIIARVAAGSQSTPPVDAVDLDHAGAAGARMLRAHRLAARSMGLTEPLEELITSAGPRQQVIRALARHPDAFLMLLLDKPRANLALARFQLIEAERAIG